MAGRPQLWKPFCRVSWLREYQYTDDGRIRDRSRNVVNAHGPDFEVTLRIAETSRRVTFPKREILALEYFGLPDFDECVVCSRRLHYGVYFLNGNSRDCSRDNMKLIPSIEARRHELACVRWVMRNDEIPPYAKTVSKRALQRREDD